MHAQGITVRRAGYAAEGETIRRIRDIVFVDEQRVPVELEHDEHDAVAMHVLAFDGTQPVGTGRILADGRIGRMAVLASHRGRGLGRAILEALIGIAEQQGMRTVWCNAQCHALAFYEGFGFVAEGPVFLEAGIEHRRMTRRDT
jgi:predicted GNAT family N-acyltransferase